MMKNLRREAIRVTPELAAAWLGSNPDNRYISDLKVAEYACDMREGRWNEDNPDCQITWLDDGTLGNGQHRLWAVIMADTPVWMWVIWDAPPSVMDVIDKVKPRTYSDELEREHRSYTKSIAAAARILARYERYPDKVWSGAATSAGITATSIQEYGTKIVDDLEQLAPQAKRLAKATPCPASPWLAFLFLVTHQSDHPDQLDAFCAEILDGTGPVGFPTNSLRQAQSVRLKRWGSGQSDLLILTKVWNRFVGQKPLRLIKIPARDELPMPKVL